jgi:phosphoglucosamine mutase
MALFDRFVKGFAMRGKRSSGHMTREVMQRMFFGTDGIRGKANVHPMTCEIALLLGRAVTHYFQQKISEKRRPLIIVGKDTRLSCYMLEQAFSAGVCSQGGQVILTGPLPTPGVSFVTQSMRADAGVVISASHNSFEDNGIKIFDSKGLKLPDEVELEIEHMLMNPHLLPTKVGKDLGRAKRIDEIEGRYVVYVKSAFDSTYDLEGMRIVLDCANGAAYKASPMIFNELGAEVIAHGIWPNGHNINDQCGSLHPREAQEMVKKYRADLGICLDGDADRVVIIDELGQVADGDALIALFARLMVDQKILKPGDEVIGTVMSNIGLEVYLRSLGLEFVRTPVGDRYILERMLREDSSGQSLKKLPLGGEPSGHIIFGQYANTGDGTLAGLKMIECMRYYGKPASQLLHEVPLFPSVLLNIVVKEKRPFTELPHLLETQQRIETELGTEGRVLLRYSGTEAKVRIMVEGRDKVQVQKYAEELAAALKQSLEMISKS